MRNLRIGLLVLLCVLWAGAVWAVQAPVPQTGQVISYDAEEPRSTAQDGARRSATERRRVADTAF